MVVDPATARHRLGLTQARLARRAGCSVRYVKRLEKAGKYPKRPWLRDAYMAALGLVNKDI